jgi:N-succinyldiaminopimelate aminotransferase
MNPNLKQLHPYPFQRLRELFAGAEPPAGIAPISLSIGEPRHPTPHFITEAVISHLHGLSNYPLTKGSAELRETIAGWLQRRFQLGDGGIDAETQVLPVNGTREALFAFAQAVVDSSANNSGKPAVLMPNPFYQIYEGAALLAGAEPVYLNTLEENGFLPDLDAVADAVWRRCQLLYLCSPGNPAGAVATLSDLQQLLELADRHDFIIASDECYSEIYPHEDRPPMGLLQACKQLGRDDYRRCVVFHSLSKRSNAPGLRSGFVAGDAAIMEKFLLYRTYHGCAMSAYAQAASVAAWSDEQHVQHNRALYRQKFSEVRAILKDTLDPPEPQGGFYLWPKVPADDQQFARQLYQQQHLTVLPGSLLSRDADGCNPGSGRVRLALVAERDDCVLAAERIATLVRSL